MKSRDHKNKSELFVKKDHSNCITPCIAYRKPHNVKLRTSVSDQLSRGCSVRCTSLSAPQGAEAEVESYGVLQPQLSPRGLEFSTSAVIS